MSLRPDGTQSLQTRVAGPGDEARLLELVRAFYAEDRIVFDPVRVSNALHALLADPACGTILLLGDGDGIAGYLALTRGFSLEQGGHFALLDELYLGPAARGRGWGADALAAAIEVARGWQVATPRLEVHHHNPRAKALYQRLGFADDHRDLLTLDLAAPAP
ncbi:GNAT family N-acetyltransferase [Luteimonas sp. BDR2-5]|uniref:GNAT family N-acetyltransferase n=1 Tax=Proluteimonas luteida TaxID=2878685 RepID=UPI001E2E785B|nr:GNAT family N-acetyltransferase [Luteimonas sp. BDR2-5]MCD9027714.1 GNAT family N-acetyltransferase [Luteimonas sp. BDR2-5]